MRGMTVRARASQVVVNAAIVAEEDRTGIDGDIVGEKDVSSVVVRAVRQRCAREARARIGTGPCIHRTPGDTTGCWRSWRRAGRAVEPDVSEPQIERPSSAIIR